MDFTALDESIATLQGYVTFCNSELASTRIGSSITEEYKRTIAAERNNLNEAITVLQEERALLAVLDSAKLTQAQANLLYAPISAVGPTIKGGLVNLAAGGTSVVTFGTAFPAGVTPKVTVSSQFNTTDTSTTLCAHTITNVGFTIRGAGNLVGNVAWIATSAGNA